jgi:hypothetical protein
MVPDEADGTSSLPSARRDRIPRPGDEAFEPFPRLHHQHRPPAQTGRRNKLEGAVAIGAAVRKEVWGCSVE